MPGTPPISPRFSVLRYSDTTDTASSRSRSTGSPTRSTPPLVDASYRTC
jgi:hypothetical protein